MVQGLALMVTATKVQDSVLGRVYARSKDPTEHSGRLPRVQFGERRSREAVRRVADVWRGAFRAIDRSRKASTDRFGCYGSSYVLVTCWGTRADPSADHDTTAPPSTGTAYFL